LERSRAKSTFPVDIGGVKAMGTAAFVLKAIEKEKQK
jgi:hypothetical protein